jgi:signal transduction histidine kinase
LLDSIFIIAAMSLGVITTNPPISYGYALILDLVLIAVYARHFSTTALFALMCVLPSVGLMALARLEAELIIAIAGCAFAIWFSHLFARQRALRLQNENLRLGISASERIVERSMELALTSVGLTVGNLLHELRNHNMVVTTSLDYMRQNEPTDPYFQEALVDACESQSHVSAVVDQSLSKLRTTMKSVDEQFDLKAVVERAQSVCPSALRLNLELRGGPFRVRGSREDFELILENLLRNAKQAGAQSVHISFQIEPSGQAAEVQVTDDGPGLPDNATAKLFQPFGTMGNKRSGTGLGLYLAKRRVEVMGGQIEAQNSAAGGACFKILLPGRPFDDSIASPEAGPCDVEPAAR